MKMASTIYRVWNCGVMLLFMVENVLGYYCDNDKCGEEEYCCGENVCCKSYKVWDLWYFWCGFLFFMLMLFVCTCMWRYRFLSSGAIIIKGVSYSPLQQVDTDSQAAHGMDRFYRNNSHKPKLYAAPVGTPPPYNQISAAQVKMAAPPPSYSQVVGMGEL